MNAQQKLMMGSVLILAAVAIGFFLYGFQLMQSYNTQLPPEEADAGVPVMFDLPDFTLTERSGQPVSLSDLEGKVWIAQFFFARCQGPCPVITARTSVLQEILKEHSQWERMRLVSFTVDPENDTPEALRAYADRAHADPKQWLFLTGERADLWPLIEDGFKLLVADQPEDTTMPIAHSTRHVLVDTQGRIRGYYDALGNDGRSALLRDLDLVLNDEPVN